MLKSTFAKYLIAFVIIILISFLVLSGIVTTMIRSYFSDDKEERLVSTAEVVSAVIEFHKQEDLDAVGFVDYFKETLFLLINNDPDIDITILNREGNVLLSTVGVDKGDDGFRRPLAPGQVEAIDINLFSNTEMDDGSYTNMHFGTVDGFLPETSIACLEDIYVNEAVRGYIITSYSTVKEDAFIVTARSAVVTSCAWVMIAAVIAVYFITNRIISPLRTMTAAAKKFGKGDFSTRVHVSGTDEISELSLAFNNMADSLEKLEKMRSSFLASVSHDLRTPMTTIAGFIDGILSGAIPHEKEEYYLQIISSEVHRLSRLVSQLLDISRLESGDRRMTFEAFDVAEMARIILISLEQKLEDKSLDVSFVADEDEMMVYADKDAIYQVIYNLCHNGIKFANNGGRFEIRLQNDDQKKVKITVLDEGVTIDKEEQRLIFDRFYKTDSSRGLDKSGVGLGLYICKTLIDAHGETIGVNSDNGVTEFYFTVKRAK